LVPALLQQHPNQHEEQGENGSAEGGEPHPGGLQEYG